MTQARCIVDSIEWAKEGQLFDIAHVYEFPGRLMIRKEDGSWPVPDDVRFGWGEDYFDARGRSIEIQSCGYEEFGSQDGYGVYLTDKQIQAWDIFQDRDEDWPFEVPIPARIAPTRYRMEDIHMAKIPDGMAGSLSYDMWRLSRLGSIQLAKDIANRMFEIVGIEIDDESWQPIYHEIWTPTWYTARGQITFDALPDDE